LPPLPPITSPHVTSPQDQLKAFKLQGKTELKFTCTQKNRVAYCTQLQALLFEAHGDKANDLTGDDSGCDGDGVVRRVRRREGGGSGKKRKGWNELNGYWWKDDETFDIERILDKKIETRSIGKVTTEPPLRNRPSKPLNRNRQSRSPQDTLVMPKCCLQVVRAHCSQAKKKSTKEFVYYKVMWANFPPEFASWEPETEIHDDYIDEYEASVEAEAELEMEEEAEDDDDSVDEE
jgi:hypothetical protein